MQTSKAAQPKPKQLACPNNCTEPLHLYLTLLDPRKGGLMAVYCCSECNQLVWADGVAFASV